MWTLFEGNGRRGSIGLGERSGGTNGAVTVRYITIIIVISSEPPIAEERPLWRGALVGFVDWLINTATTVAVTLLVG